MNDVLDDTLCICYNNITSFNFLKFDLNGAMILNKMYLFPDYNCIYLSDLYWDGSFLYVSGSLQFDNFSGLAYISCFNSDGDILWEKIWGDSYISVAETISSNTKEIFIFQ